MTLFGYSVTYTLFSLSHLQLIGQNRQEFIDILNEPASSGAGESAPSPSSDSSGGAGAPPPAPGGLPPGMQGAQVLQQQPGMISIQVTPEEKEAIERVSTPGPLFYALKQETLTF